MSEGAEANPGKICKEADKKGDFSRKNLVATCTAAYLAAPTNQARADVLTARSVAWLVTDDDADATFDRQMAVALDPGNADRHANLGFAYVRASHSWAGEREFDRSLAIRILGRTGRSGLGALQSSQDRRRLRGCQKVLRAPAERGSTYGARRPDGRQEGSERGRGYTGWAPTTWAIVTATDRAAEVDWRH